MAENQAKNRREKLRELRKKRQEQPGYEGNRTGMRGLFAGNEPAAQPQQQQGGPQRPLLKRLARNPKVRQMVSQWLAQQGGNQDLQAGNSEALSPEELGLDRLHENERVTSSSSPDEIERYRRQLQNRADWLEAALEETLMELDRISQFSADETAATERLAPAAGPKTKASAGKKGTAGSRKKAVRKSAPKKKAAAKPAATKLADSEDSGAQD